MNSIDSVLLLSFGGPEHPDDIMPFLDNVLRGKHVPEERKLEVAEHYRHMGGSSPINACNRQFAAHLEAELAQRGKPLPVYFGNRNWHPYLADTLRDMQRDGVRRAALYITSAYGSYSGCRQYREDIIRAQQEVGDQIELIQTRKFFNHPGFITANADAVRKAWRSLGPKSTPALLFSAHSIPCAMADTSPYVPQLNETAKLVAQAVSLPYQEVVWQSRSGPPHQPWLEPDVCDAATALAKKGVTDLIVAPIGFVCDHIEVLFDLDEELSEHCQTLGIRMARASTAGNHPAMVAAIADLVEETTGARQPAVVGDMPPICCEANCCPPPKRPPKH